VVASSCPPDDGLLAPFRVIPAVCSQLSPCLIATIAVAMAGCAGSPEVQSLPAIDVSRNGLATASMQAEGLDPARIAAGIERIASGDYGNIHSLLIFRRGRLVSETYFPGRDQNNHQGDIGVVQHSRDTLHDIRSVSKTVVALAVLRAREQGHVGSLDQPIFDFFPEYRRHAEGSKAGITIRHALTMTAGLDWNEEVAFAHPDSSAAGFQRAADSLDYVLGRRLVAKPGTRFNYNGGLTQLLAAIVHRATGCNIETYVRDELLTPLGIRQFEWARRRDGEADADSGLRLRSRDMAKIGLLIANRGRWAGRQILAARSIEEAISEHIGIPQAPDAAALGDRQGYGYQLWRFYFLVGSERINLLELSGNGGQKVFIDEAERLMVVTTAGEYDRRGPKIPLDIYIDIVRPALIRTSR
jgi:CubicO group peptidase (beta-lactamase class C family)